MVLGLDCSTTTCGWAVSENGELKDAGFIDISHIPDNKNKSYHILGELRKKSFIMLISRINLEAPLSGFMGGCTTQQTIIKLVRFNAVFEYILAEEFKIPVNLMSVSTMRKKVLGKARVSGLKNKEFVKLYLPKIIPSVKTFHVMNKRGNLDKRCEDIYDAVIASLA